MGTWILERGILERGLSVLVLGGGLVLGGCKADPLPVGQTGVEATFVLGTLRAELPARVTVMTVVAAAETAMRDRGFVISSRSATEDGGRVKGKRAMAGAFEAVVVNVNPAAQGTGVSVFVEPFGDEVGSRVLMEAILMRMGVGAERAGVE